MSLRWIEGFETWGTSGDGPAVFGDLFYGKYSPANINASYDPSLVSGYKDLGLAYQNNQMTYNYFSKSLGSKSFWVVGLAYRSHTSVYSSGEHVVSLRDGSDKQLAIRVKSGTTTNEYVLNRGTTQLASLGSFANNTWLYIELKATIDGTNGSYECRVNGTSVCSDTVVNTSQSGNAYADSIRFGYTYGAYDDIYILDNATGMNDFLGPVKVEKGMPTSDSSTQWSPSTGTDNYATIDEIPVSESDYVQSKTTGHVDIFGVGSCGSSDIKGAQLNVATMLSVPGGKDLILLCDSSGSRQSETETVGEADNLIIASLVTETDPNTSAAWTQAGIDAATWGVKVG